MVEPIVKRVAYQNLYRPSNNKVLCNSSLLAASSSHFSQSRITQMPGKGGRGKRGEPIAEGRKQYFDLLLRCHHFFSLYSYAYRFE